MNFLRKAGQSLDVNKLLKKLRDTEPPNAITQIRATHILSKKITMLGYA